MSVEVSPQKVVYLVRFLTKGEPSYYVSTYTKEAASEVAKTWFNDEFGYWPNHPVLVY